MTALREPARARRDLPPRARSLALQRCAAAPRASTAAGAVARWSWRVALAAADRRAGRTRCRSRAGGAAARSAACCSGRASCRGSWSSCWCCVMVALAAQPDVTVRTVLTRSRSCSCSASSSCSPSFRRSRLGVAGALGESMLVDLRDRILGQGVHPAAAASGWYVESALRSAGGTPFAGDFVVASTVQHRGSASRSWSSTCPARASRRAPARCCSPGAFGGLLTALPPADFLPAANDYLLRQDWEEGFATADPPLPRPGHRALRDPHRRATRRPCSSPPAPGAGRTPRHRGPGARADRRRGVPLRRAAPLGHGDALLLYTDGMVETPSRDIGLGIDRMVGQAERLLRGQLRRRRGPAGGPARLAPGRPGAGPRPPALSRGGAASALERRGAGRPRLWSRRPGVEG